VITDTQTRNPETESPIYPPHDSLSADHLTSRGISMLLDLLCFLDDGTAWTTAMAENVTNKSTLNAIFFSNFLSDESICDESESTPRGQSVQDTILSHGLCIFSRLKTRNKARDQAETEIIETSESSMLEFCHAECLSVARY